MEKHWQRELLRRAAPCRAVAFDAFGTLLRRDVAYPADVFSWMEKTGRASKGFAARRVLAEREARAVGRDEITLEEIYARLPGESPQAELAAEAKALCPDADAQRLCTVLRKLGKKLYVVSDMYLPKEALGRLLQACGYPPFDGVFVSSEYDVQKRSGKLFRVFLRETGLRPDEVVFLGDDRRADRVGAALAGVGCVLLPRRRESFYETAVLDDPFWGGIWAAFLQNHSAAFPERAKALGFAVGGPLALGFTGWLHRRAVALGMQPVFLARDMDLMRRVYTVRWPGEQAGYLKVSRKSLCPAVLFAGEAALLLDALPRRELSVAEALRYCGFSGEETLPGFAGDEELALAVRPAPQRVQEFLHGLTALAQGPEGEAVREKAALTRQYLTAPGVLPQNALLADIGSGGTIQRMLEAVTGKTFWSAYLACDERLHSHLPRARAAVYLFDEKPAPHWFWMAQPLLEKLISEPCGQTIGYRRSGGRVLPVVEHAGKERTVEAFRSGTLCCLHQWKNSLLAGREPTPETAVAPFLALARRPLPKDAALLGDLSFEDGQEGFIARPQRRTRYLTCPAKLIKDAAAASWKVGFAKRLLPLPLPYDKAYAAVKNRQRRGRP